MIISCVPVWINETPVAEGCVGYRAGGWHADVTAYLVPRYRQLTRKRLQRHRSLSKNIATYTTSWQTIDVRCLAGVVNYEVAARQLFLCRTVCKNGLILHCQGLRHKEFTVSTDFL